MMAGNDHGSLLGAIAEYTERLAQNPRATVFVPLSKAYRQLGMVDDAMAIARTGVQTIPEFSPGHTLLGRLLVEKGDAAGAIACFERALAIDNEDLPALKGLARIRYQQGEHEVARQLLLKASALKSDDPTVQQALASLPPQTRGTAHAPAGEPAQKVAAPIATPTIAEIYERQGFLKRALGVYRDLLQRDPANQDLLGKYRALKARIAAGASDVTPPPAVDPPAAVAEVPPVEVAPPVVPAGQHVLQSLERLLEAVHRRRKHVQ